MRPWRAFRIGGDEFALDERDEPDEVMVARADAALYEVKRRGRDGVLVAPPAF